MAISAAVGWLGILIALGFWGTWSTPLKAKSVARSGADSTTLQVRHSEEACGFERCGLARGVGAHRCGGGWTQMV